MDLLADIRSRLPFRSSRLDEGDQHLDRIGAQLLASEEFLMAEIDRSGLISAANPALCRRRGAEPEELIGTGLLYLVNAEERDAVAGVVRGVFAGQQSGTVVARLLTANGEAMPTVQWVLSPLGTSGSKIASVLCIGTDLSPFLSSVPATTAEEPEELKSLREEAKRIEKENRRLEKELRQVAAGPPPAPPAPVPDHLVAEEDTSVTLAELERRHIYHTLQATRGRISGAKGAAVLLGLHANTLRSRMEKLGIGK